MKYYVVDAFADARFSGNPAGVCLIERELGAALMQRIAAENNLSETAFVLKGAGGYGLRWFTPKTEVALCGHATLASAFVIFNFVEPGAQSVEFTTQSGRLVVRKANDLLELDFPSKKPRPTHVESAMAAAIGAPVTEAFVYSDDLVLVLEREEQVRELAPDFALVKRLAPHGVTVTAKGDGCDFVSRFFAPNLGVNEDPVTGSAHTMLAPLWAERLKKTRMTAKQLSKRGGVLYCEDCGERVKIAGAAALYLQGEILV